MQTILMQRYAHTPARLSPYFCMGNLTASHEIGERPFPFSDDCVVVREIVCVVRMKMLAVGCASKR